MLDLVKIRYAVMSKANTSDFVYYEDEQYEYYDFKYFNEVVQIRKIKFADVFQFKISNSSIVIEFGNVDELIEYLDKELI